MNINKFLDTTGDILQSIFVFYWRQFAKVLLLKLELWSY